MVTERIDQEREYHEHYHTRRDASSLIVATYQSDLFSEAEAFYQKAGGDMRGARPVAFDISFRRLAEAKTRCGSGDVLFVQCAAEYLPFSDGSVDVVLGKQILHHLDLDVAMPEIARVLRPGGRAVFLEPLGHNIVLEAYRRLTPHLRSPTERALRVSDIGRITSHFSGVEHREFCLAAVAPVVLEALSRHRLSLHWAYAPLRSFDRWLVRTFPWLGRYYWETVMVLEK